MIKASIKFFWILLLVGCSTDTKISLAVPGQSIGEYSLSGNYDAQKIFLETNEQIFIMNIHNGRPMAIRSTDPNTMVDESRIKFGSLRDEIFKFYGKTEPDLSADLKFGAELYEYDTGVSFEIDDGKVSAIWVSPVRE